MQTTCAQNYLANAGVIPRGEQYPVRTRAVKGLTIVQVNPKRLIERLQKYATGCAGTSSPTAPRTNIKAFLAEKFYALARGATHFNRSPRRNAAIGPKNVDVLVLGRRRKELT